jgi:parallel beta-helix repeat protein
MKTLSTKQTIRSQAVVWMIVGVIIAVRAGDMKAAPPIQVNACGQILNVAGGNYLLAADLTCAGNAVTIAADDVRFNLNGFSLTSADGLGIGIELFGSGAALTGIRIKGPGTVTGFNIGVDLYNTHDTRVTGASIVGNNSGLTVTLSDAAHVSDDTISNNSQTGIFITNSENNSFSTNVVTNNGFDGFFLSATSGNVIASNDISFNATVGVQIQDGSSNNVVQTNTVNNNGGIETRGFVVVGGNTPTSPSNTIRGNTASGNQIGIYLSSGAVATAVQTNVASANFVGIVVFSGATGNTLTKNTALGSTSGTDLSDANPGCDSNAWSMNTFATDQVNGLSDGGPGTGCIQ